MSDPQSGSAEGELDYPSSYHTNTEKEEITLAFVENVRQQFQMIFPKRAELFLSPFNECGIRVLFNRFLLCNKSLFLFLLEICFHYHLSDGSTFSRAL